MQYIKVLTKLLQEYPRLRDVDDKDEDGIASLLLNAAYYICNIQYPMQGEQCNSFYPTHSFGLKDNLSTTAHPYFQTYY